jgi:lipoyl-dependent peroxiredoxin
MKSYFKGGLHMANLNVNVQATWSGGTKGNGNLNSEFLETKISIPTVLGGSGEGAHPKEIFAASVSSCYTTTLAFLLESRKITVTELNVTTEAKISDNDYIFIHYPHIVLPANATDEEIQAAHKTAAAADKACDVGNILKKAGGTIELEITVTK